MHLTLLLQSGRWQPDALSIAIGVGMGLLLGAFFALVVWPYLGRVRRGLAARWGNFLDRFRAGADERYREALAAFAAAHHPYGPGRDLAAIFVPPRLWRPTSAAAEAGPTAVAPQELHWLWPDLAAGAALPLPPMADLDALLRRGRRVFIAGGPGAGKTTLLARAAALAARPPADSAWTFLNDQLPLFFHAADLAAADWPTTAAGLLDAQPLPFDRLNRRGLEELLDKHLAAGTALFLLDGADELAQAPRESLTNWLRRWLERYPELRVIMAAPESGYASLLELGFTMTGLAPWTAPQAEAMLRGWGETAGDEPPALDRVWKPGQSPWQTTARIMAERVRGADEEAPPRWIGRLEMALRAHLPAEADDPPWLAPLCRDLWQQLALELVSGRLSSLPDARFTELASALLDQYQVTTPLTVRRLRATAEASGLLTLANGTWRFLSPIWRDFLAATRLAQEGEVTAAVGWARGPEHAQLRRFLVARLGAETLADELLAGQETMPEGLFELASWMPELLHNGAWRKTTLLRLGKMALDAGTPLALRQRAILALAQTGEPGVLAVVRQLLVDPEPLVQQTAIAALPALPAAEARELLMESFEREESALQRAVVSALTWLPPEDGQTILVRGLLASDPLVQRAAAEALALKGGADADILREAAVESSAEVRRAAAFGLALIDEPWAVALLEDLRRDDQWIVQSAAEAALAARFAAEDAPPPWAPPEPAELPWLLDWATDRGRAMPGGPAATALLLEALEPGQEAAARQAALRALGRMGLPEGAPLAAQAAVDDDPLVRETAFAALCHLSRAQGSWVGL